MVAEQELQRVTSLQRLAGRGHKQIPALRPVVTGGEQVQGVLVLRIGAQGLLGVSNCPVKVAAFESGGARAGVDTPRRGGGGRRSRLRRRRQARERVDRGLLNYLGLLNGRRLAGTQIDIA